MRIVTDECGQASTEYLIAVFIGLVITVAIGSLFSVYGTAGSRHPSALSKTFGRAPYCAPTSGEVNAQCAKDLLMH